MQKRDDREWACVPESATLKRYAASGREAERIYASGEAEKVMGKGCGEGGSPMVPPDCGEGSGGQGVREGGSPMVPPDWTRFGCTRIAGKEVVSKGSARGAHSNQVLEGHALTRDL